jgi:hypothetical protein
MGVGLLEVLQTGFQQAVEILQALVGGHILPADQGQAIGEQGHRIEGHQIWVGAGVEGSGVNEGQMITG